MKNTAQAPTPPKTVTTTFSLPEKTWRELKIRAAHERAPLREICHRAIVAYLATPLPKEVA